MCIVIARIVRFCDSRWTSYCVTKAVIVTRARRLRVKRFSDGRNVETHGMFDVNNPGNRDRLATFPMVSCLERLSTIGVEDVLLYLGSQLARNL